MSQQPQGQGWWQATDGRWYPPEQWRPPLEGWSQPGQSGPQGWSQPGQPGQQGQPQPHWQPQPPPQYTPQPPPARPRGRRGCLIAVLVVVVLVLVVVGVAGYFVQRAVTAVDEVTGGSGAFGPAQCPTEQDVSAAVGSPVTLAVSGNVVVASGCSYLAVDREGGADVQITVGFALAADDQFAQVASDAATQGTTPEEISVGDRAESFGGPGRSEAIAVTGDSMVLVEVFNAGSQDIGDKRDAATALLEQVIAAR